MAHSTSKKELFRRLQKKFSITYYYSTRLLPLEIRNHVRALYVFLRYIDDIVDYPRENPHAELSNFENYFWKAWEGKKQETEKFDESLGKSDERNTVIKPLTNQNIDFKRVNYSLIVEEFLKLAYQFKFEKAWIKAFLESMRMDLEVKRYATFEELQKYIYGSAEVVALMVNRIAHQGKFSMKSGKSLDLSPQSDEVVRKIAMAMQLTNTIRDIKEDYQRGRIYFPQEDFKKFDLSEQEFVNGKNSKFIQFIEFQIARVLDLYKEIFQNAHFIPPKARLPILTATYVYFNTLEKIALRPDRLWFKDFKKTLLSFPKAILQAKRLDLLHKAEG